MAKDDDALLSVDDAAAIGFKIADMADRVRPMHALVPGARAQWRFEMDDVAYVVTVAVARDG